MRRIIIVLFDTATAVVGYHIHHSAFWAVVDFIFSPLAWLKWLIFQEVSLSVIRESFKFFFN